MILSAYISTIPTVKDSGVDHSILNTYLVAFKTAKN